VSSFANLPSAPSRAAWRDAQAILREHRGRLLAGFGLLVVSRLAGLALPASSKYLVDDVIGRGNASLLGPLALAILAASLVQAGTALALSRVLGLAAQDAIYALRRELQRHTLRLPLSFFDGTKAGVLVSRIMSDPDALRNLMGSGLVHLASSLMTAVFALCALLILNPRLTLATLVLLGLFASLMVYAFQRIRPLYRLRAETSSQVQGRLNETLGGIRVVKAYRAEEREARVFSEGLAKLFATVSKEVTATAGVGAFAIVIFGAISAVLAYFGGRLIITGEMTLGDFVMYVFFVGLLVTPLMRIAETATQMGEAFAGLDRIRELRERAPEDAQDESRASVPFVEGRVEFRDVCFSYAPGRPVLRNVSFDVPPGSTTALVGPSGAGKSTLIGLVLGFYRPTSGTVSIDGRNLAELRSREFRGHVGVVLQDSFLFDGTIAENIAFSRPEATRAEIESAARAAHCDEFARGLEQGYDTRVGERGVRLSGGQKQRLAIARALLADPRILILDEATSSLDSESEAFVQAGLSSLLKGRTSFVIAHRLSTVKNADQILVVEYGEIVERGSHETLMSRSGRYRDLYERQFRLREPRERVEQGQV
jgi:subfamily B ATP-binding cassette protein MsbA